MSVDRWSQRSELLNAFGSEINMQTYGRLSGLDVDFEDREVVVRASSRSYFDLQLALRAIKNFATKHPQLNPERMEFEVNGQPMVLRRSVPPQQGRAAPDRFDKAVSEKLESVRKGRVSGVVEKKQTIKPPNKLPTLSTQLAIPIAGRCN